MPRRNPVGWMLFACTAVLVGCSEPAAEKPPPEVQPVTQPVPPILQAVDARPDMNQMPSSVPIPRVTDAKERFTWTAPAHWQTGRVSAMRAGSFTIPGPEGASADLAITSFPGDVGGDLANVNRWRQQVGLAPLETVEGVGNTVEIGGLPGRVVLLVGRQQSVLAAWVRLEGATWFFKLSGPVVTVGNEEPAFLAFLTTIRREPVGG